MTTPTTVVNPKKTDPSVKQSMSCEKKQQQQHLTTWFAMFAFTVIALTSIVTTDGFRIQDQSREVQWVISAISITLTFTTLSIIAHWFIAEQFMSTNLETGMVTSTLYIFFCFIQWCR
jgi:hypothetical protein